MKRVAVLGDVRVHIVRGERRKESSSPLGPLGETHDATDQLIAGGAKMMGQAIELALKGMELSPPAVLSYAGDFSTWAAENRGEDGSIIGSYWDLKLTHLSSSSAASRFRLVDPMNDRLSSPWLPNSPVELKDKRCLGQLAALVIDDLGLRFRNVALGNQQSDSDDNDDSQPEAYLRKFLHGFADRCKALRSTRTLPSLDPLLIVSVDGPLPDSPLASDDNPVFWPWLLKHKELHDRTVIILDADHLRRDGLRISEALSWERTAQNSIRELRSNTHLQPLRQFRHLIVRYGVTGALHAYRNRRGWNYDLYFDPNNDDIAFVDPKRDGRVLGASSVLVASLVQSLLVALQRHEAKPQLELLEDIIDRGLHEAVSRAQFHCHFGYGATIDDFVEMTESTPFPGELFAPRLPMDIAGSCSVSRIEVPLFQTPEWSILSQSCEFRFAQVAQEIVLHGVSHILNQPPWPTASQLAEELFWHVRIWRDAEKRPIQHDETSDAIGQIVRDLVNQAPVFRNRHRALREKVVTLISHATQSAERQIASYTKTPESPRRTSALKNALKTSLAAVSESLDYLLADKIPIVAPVARFGKLPGNGERDKRMVVVDRQEIEGFRTLRNVIRSHLDQVYASHRDSRSRVERPLSIAVFGPPGSGKSFAVRRIVESVEIATDTEILSFSLAQFSQTKHLEDAFQEVNNAIAQRKVPIVFFDEFDSDFDGDELGWLKYFLAPMEDGVFRNFTVTDAILVFAGGTSSTFSEFSRENRSRSDPQWVDFSHAKGPDFISRLRGHVDLLGINPIGPGDELFLIRRAILLRSLLCNMLNMADWQESRIEPDLLRALLRVPEYKHGGRSLRILLDHCIRRDMASKSFLPTLGQLNMHINGKAFLDILSGFDEPNHPR
jgi:hypothetical protein